MRLIDADELKKKLRLVQDSIENDENILNAVFNLINNAPTVEAYDTINMQASGNVYITQKRPQGEREFIEIFAEYREDDYDTLPEYKGKPYYSIHYRENGEEFVGYGTYKIEVLSRYLRDYFFNTDMKGGAE